MVKRLRIFYVLGFIFGFCSCGDDVVDVTFTLRANSSDVQTLLANGGLTYRIFYRYDGLSDSDGVVVEPFKARPPGSGSRFEWQQALDVGNIISNDQVFIAGVPLGKVNLEVCVELLRNDGAACQGGSGTTCPNVVAYSCYGPFPTKTGADQMIADSAVALDLRIGRTCGAAASAQNLAINADFNTSCP